MNRGNSSMPAEEKKAVSDDVKEDEAAGKEEDKVTPEKVEEDGKKDAKNEPWIGYYVDEMFEGFMTDGLRHGDSRCKWSDGDVMLCTWQEGVCGEHEIEDGKKREQQARAMEEEKRAMENEGKKRLDEKKIMTRSKTAKAACQPVKEAAKAACQASADKPHQKPYQKQFFDRIKLARKVIRPCVQCKNVCECEHFRCLNCEAAYCQNCEKQWMTLGYEGKRPPCFCVIDSNGRATHISETDFKTWIPKKVLAHLFKSRKTTATLQSTILILLLQYATAVPRRHTCTTLCCIGSLIQENKAHLLNDEAVKNYVATRNPKPSVFLQLENRWKLPPAAHPVAVDTEILQKPWSINLFNMTRPDVDSLAIDNFKLTSDSIKTRLTALIGRSQVDVGTTWSSVRPRKGYHTICGPRPVLIIYISTNLNSNYVKKRFAQQLGKDTGGMFIPADSGSNVFKQSHASVDVTVLFNAWLKVVNDIQGNEEDDVDVQISKMKLLRIVFHGWKSEPKCIEDPFDQGDREEENDMYQSCKDDCSEFKVTYDLGQKYEYIGLNECMATSSKQKDIGISLMRVPVFGISGNFSGFQKAHTWSMFGPIAGTEQQPMGSIMFDRTDHNDETFLPKNVQRVKVYPSIVNLTKASGFGSIDHDKFKGSFKQLKHQGTKVSNFVEMISGSNWKQCAPMLMSFRIECTMQITVQHQSLHHLVQQCNTFQQRLLTTLSQNTSLGLVAVNDIRLLSEWCLQRYFKLFTGDTGASKKFHDKIMARDMLLSLLHVIGYHDFPNTKHQHARLLIDLNMEEHIEPEVNNPPQEQKHVPNTDDLDWRNQTTRAMMLKPLKYMNVWSCTNIQKKTVFRYMYKKICPISDDGSPSCPWCHSSTQRLKENIEANSTISRSVKTAACRSKDFQYPVDLALDVYARLQYHIQNQKNWAPACLKCDHNEFSAIIKKLFFPPSTKKKQAKANDAKTQVLSAIENMVDPDLVISSRSSSLSQVPLNNAHPKSSSKASIPHGGAAAVNINTVGHNAHPNLESSASKITQHINQTVHALWNHLRADKHGNDDYDGESLPQSPPSPPSHHNAASSNASEPIFLVQSSKTNATPSAQSPSDTNVSSGVPILSKERPQAVNERKGVTQKNADQDKNEKISAGSASPSTQATQYPRFPQFQHQSTGSSNASIPKFSLHSTTANATPSPQSPHDTNILSGVPKGGESADKTNAVLQPRYVSDDERISSKERPQVVEEREQSLPPSHHNAASSNASEPIFLVQSSKTNATPSAQSPSDTNVSSGVPILSKERPQAVNERKGVTQKNVDQDKNEKISAGSASHQHQSTGSSNASIPKFSVQSSTANATPSPQSQHDTDDSSGVPKGEESADKTNAVLQPSYDSDGIDCEPKVVKCIMFSMQGNNVDNAFQLDAYLTLWKLQLPQPKTRSITISKTIFELRDFGGTIEPFLNRATFDMLSNTPNISDWFDLKANNSFLIHLAIAMNKVPLALHTALARNCARNAQTTHENAWIPGVLAAVFPSTSNLQIIIISKNSENDTYMSQRYGCPGRGGGTTLESSVVLMRDGKDYSWLRNVSIDDVKAETSRQKFHNDVKYVSFKSLIMKSIFIEGCHADKEAPPNEKQVMWNTACEKLGLQQQESGKWIKKTKPQGVELNLSFQDGSLTPKSFEILMNTLTSKKINCTSVIDLGSEAGHAVAQFAFKPFVQQISGIEIQFAWAAHSAIILQQIHSQCRDKGYHFADTRIIHGSFLSTQIQNPDWITALKSAHLCFANNVNWDKGTAQKLSSDQQRVKNGDYKKSTNANVAKLLVDELERNSHAVVFDTTHFSSQAFEKVQTLELTGTWNTVGTQQVQVLRIRPYQFKDFQTALRALCRDKNCNFDELPRDWLKNEVQSDGDFVTLKDHVMRSNPFTKSNATVHDGWSVTPARVVCIKQLAKTDAHKNIDREIETLKLIAQSGDASTHNVISYIGTDEDRRGDKVLIFEMVNASNFNSDLKSMTAVQVAKYMYKLLQSLRYLHNRGVVHRDVKPANFLHNFKSDTFRLIDFGSAVTGNVVFGKKGGGTQGFKAPETMLNSKSQTAAVDIWSAGIIWFSLLTGKKHVLSEMIGGVKTCEASHLREIGEIVGTTKMMQLNNLQCEEYGNGCQYQNKTGWSAKALQSVIPERSWKLDDQALDLLSQMLEVDPTKRITSSAALDHLFWGGQ